MEDHPGTSLTDATLDDDIDLGVDIDGDIEVESSKRSVATQVVIKASCKNARIQVKPATKSQGKDTYLKYLFS